MMPKQQPLSAYLAGSKRTHQQLQNQSHNPKPQAQSQSKPPLYWAKLNTITPATFKDSIRIKSSAFTIGRHPNNDL